MPCPCGGLVCARCARDLEEASSLWVHGVFVTPRFRHRGPARAIVHRLKYSGIIPRGVGRVLAPLVPPEIVSLVPVPRVLARRWRYGIDPAFELALAMAQALGIEVVSAIRAPVWVHRRAGSADSPRGTPSFRLCARIDPSVALLVDDVVTSGATLAAAGDACGVRRAVTLTSAATPRAESAPSDTMSP